MDLGWNTYLLADSAQEKGDYASVFTLFQTAMDEGSVDAINRIAICYDEGLGTSVDKAKARQFYLKAIRKHDICATGNLAIFYRDAGKLHLAKKWFRHAISLGNLSRELDLVKIYLLNSNSRNKKRALKILLNLRENTDKLSEADEEELEELIEKLTI